MSSSDSLSMLEKTTRGFWCQILHLCKQNFEKLEELGKHSGCFDLAILTKAFLSELLNFENSFCVRLICFNVFNN